MNYSSPPPFELGETLKGTDADSNLINEEIIGKIFVLSTPDMTGVGITKRRTSRQLVAVAARNTTGAAALGKRVVQFGNAGGVGDLEVFDGYAASLAQQRIGVLDEFLPSGGVADDDIAWVVLKGPVTVLLPTVSADHNGDVAVGNWLVAATGSTTGNSTSGRVSNVTLPGQTGATDAFNFAKAVVGKALSAATTHNTTGVEILINACCEY